MRKLFLKILSSLQESKVGEEQCNDFYSANTALNKTYRVHAITNPNHHPLRCNVTVD